MSDWRGQVDEVLAPVLARSRSIDAIAIGEGNLSDVGLLYRRVMGEGRAMLVADENTWAAAGEVVEASFAAAGIEAGRHILPGAPRVKPTRSLGEEIAGWTREATPVAIGAGVLNDLVKYAAFRLERPYLCVATAASMDGYSSAGAPLVDDGFKKTIPSRPPRAILADLSVIGAAPSAMAGWGYGDLAGKVPAGADWILADGLGIEPIDDLAWPLVQAGLRGWLADPEGVARGEAGALAGLFVGLTVVGLAMEFHGSSRPASGADHQIAHLWEMADLYHAGERVAHGAAVAVGCMDVLALYEWLLGQDLSALDPERILARAPSLEAEEAAIDRAFPGRHVAERARAETAAKRLAPAAHRERIETIRRIWPELRDRLARHLIPAGEMRRLLRAAGAPTQAADIGVGPAEHRATIAASRHLRSRYTLLDLLAECGLLDDALDAVFAGPDLKR